MGAKTETEVLIIGAGPAGLASALFLSEYGVENALLEKYGWTVHTPRAHITPTSAPWRSCATLASKRM